VPVFLSRHVLVKAVLEGSTLLSGIVTSLINAAESLQAELVGAIMTTGIGVAVGVSPGRLKTALIPFTMTM
jgi:uncharacterized membrane protein